jgi:chromosome segregation ATPase
MRTKLGHVSHLLRISSAIRSTCRDLRSELALSSHQTSEQQASVQDSRQQLAKLTGRMELLRSAQEELQSGLDKTKGVIADIQVH